MKKGFKVQDIRIKDISGGMIWKVTDKLAFQRQNS